MRRILILGGSGSGKSTLARKLGEKLGLPVIHLDTLYWKKGWTPVSADEFDALLEEVLRREAWIVDGNYDRTLPARLEVCDTVLYLDYPRIVCLWGIGKRIFKNYGKTRPDMGAGCPERIDWEFIKWTWNFNKMKRAEYLRLLEGVSGKTVYVFHSRREGGKFLENLDGPDEKLGGGRSF